MKTIINYIKESTKFNALFGANKNYSKNTYKLYKYNNKKLNYLILVDKADDYDKLCKINNIKEEDFLKVIIKRHENDDKTVLIRPIIDTYTKTETSSTYCFCFNKEQFDKEFTFVKKIKETEYNINYWKKNNWNINY